MNKVFLLVVKVCSLQYWRYIKNPLVVYPKFKFN